MRTVVAPIGGAGNHVRWLCLLDENFDLSDVTKTKADNYNFILNTVYNKARNAKNWLKIEYLWREAVDKKIKLQHTFELTQDKQVLHIDVGVDRCLDHYRNFFPVNKEKFMRNYQDSRPRHQMPDQMLSINFEKYYLHDIDETLIGKINDFFSLKIDYEKASQVHKKWLYLIGNQNR